LRADLWYMERREQAEAEVKNAVTIMEFQAVK
jgi:hypothetical protein